MSPYRRRRTVVVLIILISTAIAAAIYASDISPSPVANNKVVTLSHEGILALDALENIEIKGRAPKTHYSREAFGGGWLRLSGCDTRNIILNRDLVDVVVDQSCNVTQGTLNDPYTGKAIMFKRGSGTSTLVQIDHVVALSNAWQTGAFQLSSEERQQLANDPLELLAVDGSTNQQKSDGDAATWLPPYKAFRCQYVARQIAVKLKYHLWMTDSEKKAIRTVLSMCETQTLPTE